MGRDSAVLRDRANEALRRRDWPEVLRSLSAADPNELTGDELLALYEAECAAEVDRHRAQSVVELAHAAYVRDDDMEGASWTALQMIIIATINHELDLARAWESSLLRTMEGLAESKVHVYVSIALSMRSIYDGDYESVIAMVREAQELARRLGERDLEIWARQREAIATVRSGDYERGLEMLDETMVGSLSIDVRPSIRGALMCHGVSLCQDVGDLPRAAKWIEATDRSFGACGINLSGECHMHRAQVLKMRGSLARAEVGSHQEARSSRAILSPRPAARGRSTRARSISRASQRRPPSSPSCGTAERVSSQRLHIEGLPLYRCRHAFQTAATR